jgi:uncharacterized protein (TIGR02466 family)
MTDGAEISCMFVELCYRRHVPELAARNPEMLARALEVRSTVKSALDWPCDTFATLDSDYNVLEDAVFSDLINTTKLHVLEFATVFGVKRDAQLACKDAWINVADPGAFQETHIHPSMHFSAVYYVEAPENCGDLLFRSHESMTDMFPLPTDEPSQANTKTYWQKALPGSLLIFRSNLAHMVAKNKATSPRVSVAMNFTFSG